MTTMFLARARFSSRRPAWVVHDVRSVVGWAVGCFVLGRGIEYLALATHLGKRSMFRRLTSWDSGYYIALANHGYPSLSLRPKGVANYAAFFPLYPAMIHVTDRVLPGSAFYAATFVTLLSGVAAAALIALLARDVLMPRIGEAAANRAAVVTSALWSTAPLSFVLGMPYTEATFTACAAGCLFALLRQRWWIAGLLALFGGLLRPTGIVLAVCCAVAAAAMLYRCVRADLSDEIRLKSSASQRFWLRIRPSLPALGSALIAPLGVLGYLAWVGWRMGRLDGWFEAQRRGWGSYNDGGSYMLHEIVQNAQSLSRSTALVVVVVFTFVLAPMALVLMVRDRLPRTLVLFPIGLMLIAYTTHGQFGSFARYLLPGFPLLLPVAARAARLPRSLLVALVVAACCASAYVAISVTGQAAMAP